MVQRKIGLSSELKSLTVKSIDIAGTIELFEKSSVDEILGVSGFRRGNLFGEFGKNHFEAVESRIGLSRHEAAQDLVGIVEIPFLLQTHMFAQRALGYLHVYGRELNPFDERLYNPARDVRRFRQVAARRYQTCVLEGDAHFLHVSQYSHACFLRFLMIRWLDNGCIDGIGH